MRGPRISRHEKILRFLLTLFTVYCLLSTVTGCGRNQGAGGAKKEIEIVMWLVGSEGQALTIKELSDRFYKDTKIRVRCEAVSWGDAHSKYLTSIAGGVAPDIGTVGLTWGSEFGKLGAMVDLMKAYPDEVNAIKETVFPGLWNSIEYEGRVYGIPFDMTEYVLYYRNDIIKNPPKDWNELVSLLEELRKDNKGMIFDWGSLSWIGYSPFLWQAGGGYYNQDYTKSTIDSEEAAVALKFFAELYTKYNVPKTKIPVEQGMRTGDFPLAISGNWKIGALHLSAPEISGKWSIATLPKGPSGKYTAFIGGRIMGIFEQSKNKEASWAFIKFLFTPEIQEKLYEAALIEEDTYLPPSKKTWDILKMDAHFKKVLVEQAHDAKGPPAIPLWDMYSKYIDEAIQKIILQNGDPKKELAAAKEHIMRLIKK